MSEDETKSVLEGRMSKHDSLQKTSQVIDAIQAYSSVAVNPDEEAASVVKGDSKAKMEFIAEVVRNYRKDKSDKPLKDYFNENYREKALILSKPVDAIQEAVRNQDVTKVEAPVEKRVEEKVKEEVKPEVQVKPQIDSVSREERVERLVKVLSNDQHISPEEVRKRDMDVIEKILSIANGNENKEVSDLKLINACLHMVSDEHHEASFLLEALDDAHRDELLKRAVSGMKK